MKMNYLLKMVLVGCFILPASSVSVAETVHVCLAEKGGQCDVSVSRYEIFKGSKNVDDYHSLGEPKEYFKVLSGYYSSARKNKKSEILSYFSETDGSYQSKKEDMDRISDMYAHFYDVERVDVTAIIRVDDYAMVGVSWYKKDGSFIGKWIELLHCPSECKLSDRLMSKDTAIQLLQVVTVEGSSISQVSHNFNASYPSNKSRYQGNFGANVTYYKTDEKKFAIGNARILALFNDMKKNYSDLSSKGMEVFKKGILDIYAKHWRNLGESTYFTSVQDGKIVGVNIFSLANQMNEALTLKPIMILNGNKVQFHVYLADWQNSGKYLYVFPIDADGYVISQANLKGNDLLIAQAIYTPTVLKAIEAISPSLLDNFNILSK